MTQGEGFKPSSSSNINSLNWKLKMMMFWNCRLESFCNYQHWLSNIIIDDQWRWIINWLKVIVSKLIIFNFQFLELMFAADDFWNRCLESIYRSSTLIINQFNWWSMSMTCEVIALFASDIVVFEHQFVELGIEDDDGCNRSGARIVEYRHRLLIPMIRRSSIPK